MGLSRNKVAVSEGAAGSPPFYGEREDMEISSYKRLYRETDLTKKLLFNFEGLQRTRKYGGVAQLGEHLPCKQGVKGSIPFISTKSARPAVKRKSLVKERHGLIAQQVRARA